MARASSAATSPCAVESAMNDVLQCGGIAVHLQYQVKAAH